MLYGFLLDADPAAAPSKSWRSDIWIASWSPDPASSRPTPFCELYRSLRPGDRSAGPASKLYETIDLPLVRRAGAHGDDRHPHRSRRNSARLSARMEAEIARLSAEIYELAGKPFNINSPQQLGKVLFEDLKLPAPVKYGKGKAFRPRRMCWKSLAAEHEIARKVLEYRQLTKLKGTYVDALPALIDPATGRLHTSFNQAGAATGRLSSSNPNLQNIPIRTELGREIRAAFVPAAGLEADRGRLFADRAAAAGPHVATIRCWWTHSATARTSTRAPRPKSSACRP